MMCFKSQNVKSSLLSSSKTSCLSSFIFSRMISLRCYTKPEKFQTKRKAIFCLLLLQNFIRNGSDKYMNGSQKFQCAISEEMVPRLRNNGKTSWLGITVLSGSFCCFCINKAWLRNEVWNEKGLTSINEESWSWICYKHLYSLFSALFSYCSSSLTPNCHNGTIPALRA